MRTLLPALVVSLSLSVACGEKNIPLGSTPTAKGPDTPEAVRLQLEGRWTLLSLNAAAADGRSASVDARGELTLDGFGNLRIIYQLTNAGQATLEGLGLRPPNPDILTEGRVVINPQDRSVVYVNPEASAQPFDRELAERRQNPFALERTRFYTLGTDGVLTLVTRHDNGKDAATSRWRRQ
jgi:hypothetical protein